ncbi:MAG: serine/threonine-protein kinase, partial [Myxococcota bacterium]|nr:serine/threonine-protein kinase [Myxococcota bacterium]
MDYAHRRGVVHRDLKPANIMVGQHGEILVMDWGIAKIMGHSASADDADDPSMHDDAVQTERSIGDAHQTQMGSIAGTPAYMAPEQARGQVHKVTARSDIYALGAMLYELLAGQPPYQGSDARSVLEQVRDGPPRPLSTDRPRPGRPGYSSHARPSRGPGQAVLPPLLVSACERAMARNPHDRFRRAGELGDTLQAWLEGSQRRQDALDVMAGAQALAPQAAAMRQRAAALRAEARELLAPVERWAPEGEKLPGWQKEDEAAALEQQSEALEIEEELACHGALAHAPDLPEAHAALAARYRAEHAAIEAEHGDPARVEARLRHHLSWLPRNHPERSSHKAYLQGDGLLTLRTSPPGASVDLLRYESHRRRLSPRLVRTIGETPLERVRLPMGSYMCVI